MNLNQIVSLIRKREALGRPLNAVFLPRDDWIKLAGEIQGLKILRNTDDFGKEIPEDPSDIKILGVPIRIMGEPVPQ